MDAGLVDAERERDDAANPLLHALPHVDGAGRDADRTVGVDVEQRLGLVEQGGGEGNAEAHRHHGQALAQLAAIGIEVSHGLLAAGQVEMAAQFVPAGGRPVVGGRHAVRKGIAHAQQILPLQAFRRDAQLPRGPADGGFEDEHRLRCAEAAEGRIRRQVGAATGGGDADVGQAVGVGGVEQRAFENGRGQVGGAAGVLVEHGLVGQEIPLRIEPEAVVGGIGVAFAGQPHVVRAIELQAHRPAQAQGSQRSEAGPRRGLLLLAAEAAAQALDLDVDQVHGQPADGGDRLVHAARRLGGGMDFQAAVVARDGQRTLGFHINVLG